MLETKHTQPISIENPTSVWERVKLYATYVLFIPFCAQGKRGEKPKKSSLSNHPIEITQDGESAQMRQGVEIPLGRDSTGESWKLAGAIFSKDAIERAKVIAEKEHKSVQDVLLSWVNDLP